jgi:hypothetical protein
LKTNVGQSPPATNILIKREEHQLTKEPQWGRKERRRRPTSS